VCRYDRVDNVFRKIEDVQFVCAMGPPGGGRNTITPRFVRHFNLVAITEFGDETYNRIYSAVIDWWFKRAKAPDETRGKASGIVKATIEVLALIRYLIDSCKRTHARTHKHTHTNSHVCLASHRYTTLFVLSSCQLPQKVTTRMDFVSFGHAID
jgi:hypothetical protein